MVNKEQQLVWMLSRIIVDYRDVMCSPNISKYLHQEAKKIIKIVKENNNENK